MIFKIGLYLLIGFIINTGLGLGITLWWAIKSSWNDKMFDDIVREYSRLIAVRARQIDRIMYFWKEDKQKPDPDDAKAINRDVDDMINFVDSADRRDMIEILLLVTIAWPVEVFGVKCWTFPRIIEYVHNYDKQAEL